MSFHSANVRSLAVKKHHGQTLKYKVSQTFDKRSRTEIHTEDTCYKDEPPRVMLNPLKVKEAVSSVDQILNVLLLPLCLKPRVT